MKEINDCIYCLDASIMIDLKEYYPRHIFGIWTAFDQLVAEGRIITFRGIADECHDEECVQWFKMYKNIIKPFTPELNDCLIEILGDLAKDGKQMFKPSLEKDERDPFLVALALAEKRRIEQSLIPGNICVLTQEGRVGDNATTLKIPNVCIRYGIKCFNLFQLCEHEGWKFPLPNL